jgi:hypothetical protein
MMILPFAGREKSRRSDAPSQSGDASTRHQDDDTFRHDRDQGIGGVCRPVAVPMTGASFAGALADRYRIDRAGRGGHRHGLFGARHQAGVRGNPSSAGPRRLPRSGNQGLGGRGAISCPRFVRGSCAWFHLAHCLGSPSSRKNDAPPVHLIRTVLEFPTMMPVCAPRWEHGGTGGRRSAAAFSGPGRDLSPPLAPGFPLYRLLERHFRELGLVWDERVASAFALVCAQWATSRGNGTKKHPGRGVFRTLCREARRRASGSAWGTRSPRSWLRVEDR